MRLCFVHSESEEKRDGTHPRRLGEGERVGVTRGTSGQPPFPKGLRAGTTLHHYSRNKLLLGVCVIPVSPSPAPCVCLRGRNPGSGCPPSPPASVGWSCVQSHPTGVFLSGAPCTGHPGPTPARLGRHHPPALHYFQPTHHRQADALEGHKG